MSGLTVQGIGRFTQYFDSINQFGNDTQVQNTHDPFGLRERYASRQDVIYTLDKIDAALANFNPDEGKDLDLHGIDFRPLNDLKVNRYKTLNLERLLVASQNISQYPLYMANLSGTDLSSVNLFGADLREANLEGANLRAVILVGASLLGANLLRANLTYAILTRATLHGADLREAFAFVGGNQLTGQDLKHYLVTRFNVAINDGTKF